MNIGQSSAVASLNFLLYFMVFLAVILPSFHFAEAYFITILKSFPLVYFLALHVCGVCKFDEISIMEQLIECRK